MDVADVLRALGIADPGHPATPEEELLVQHGAGMAAGDPHSTFLLVRAGPTVEVI